MTPVERRLNFALGVGLLLVGLTVLLSGSLLESTVLPPGTIVGTARRAPALALCRLLLLLAGVYLLARRPRVTSVHLTAFALVTLAFLVAAAVLVQIAYVPRRMVSGWRSFAPATEQNELGYRGRRIAYGPKDFVVVLLGDSQVEAMALPYDQMPERLLEAQLDSPEQPVRIFSLGAGGYGQDQQLLALQEYLRSYRADLVVLWQTPTNDVWNNVFKTHMFNRNPKPTYRVDAQGMLQGPSEELGQPLGSSRIVFLALLERAFGLPRRDLAWERSLPEPYVPMDSYDGSVNYEWQERWNSNLGRMRDENLATEKSHMALMLSPRSKRMQYGLDLTRALISRIRDVVTAQHGTLVLFRTETDDNLPGASCVYVLNGKYYVASRGQFLENLDYLNNGFDTHVARITVSNWRVASDDGHLNLDATRQAMGLLAERLRGSNGNDTH